MTYHVTASMLGNYEIELFHYAAYHIAATCKRKQMVRWIKRSPYRPEAPVGPRQDKKPQKSIRTRPRRKRTIPNRNCTRFLPSCSLFPTKHFCTLESELVVWELWMRGNFTTKIYTGARKKQVTSRLTTSEGGRFLHLGRCPT